MHILVHVMQIIHVEMFTNASPRNQLSVSRPVYLLVLVMSALPLSRMLLLPTLLLYELYAAWRFTRVFTQWFIVNWPNRFVNSGMLFLETTNKQSVGSV